jgi:hypothetical protein
MDGLYIWSQATEIKFYRKVIFPGCSEPSPMPIACVVFKPETICQGYIHSDGKYELVTVNF